MLAQDDVKRIVDACETPYYIVQFIMVWSIGMILLARIFGWSTIATALAFLVIGLGIPYIGKRMVLDRTAWSQATDKRVKL